MTAFSSASVIARESETQIASVWSSIATSSNASSAPSELMLRGLVDEVGGRAVACRPHEEHEQLDVVLREELVERRSGWNRSSRSSTPVWSVIASSDPRRIGRERGAGEARGSGGPRQGRSDERSLPNHRSGRTRTGHEPAGISRAGRRNRVRSRAGPAAARSSRRAAGRGERSPAAGLGRAEDDDPVDLRRPAGLGAPELGHLAVGVDVVRGDARRAGSPPARPPIPRPARRGRGRRSRRAPGRSRRRRSRGPTIPSSVMAGRRSRRTVRRNSRYGARRWASSSEASIACESNPRNHVRSQL